MKLIFFLLENISEAVQSEGLGNNNTQLRKILTRKYAGIRLRTDVLSSWKCFIFSIVNKLGLHYGVTRIRIQIRNVNQNKNPK